ncbi:MAG: aromatic amino acid ammonia-lyase [Clostridium sp.]
MKTIVLGKQISIEEFMDIVRFRAEVEFSEDYRERVQKSAKIVEQCVKDERAVYGTTTGFGALVTQAIGREQAETLQKNIILTHAVSVGEPFGEEEVRAIILMVLQSLGRGVSGVRLELLECYRQFLNRGVVPYVPKEGSVGYLCAEAHVASVLLGEGRAYYGGELLDSREALKRAGMEPFVLSYKEGLALINGASSPTALAAIAIYDLNRVAKTADIAAAMSLEALNGLIRAYDEHVTACRPEKELIATAKNQHRILSGSEIIEAAKGTHLQDALSLRCVPQLHGAAKRLLHDAYDVVSCEINSCADNPVVYGTGDAPDIYSNGNPDASYVGMEMDAACIAAVNLAKMSERRNARFLDQNLSGYPWFLVKNPGLNSGLMIPQYTQAGLLNELRMLATPSTADSVSTSAGQEDYVSMGYNACKKSIEVVRKLEYILAVEMMSAYQAQQFVGKTSTADSELKRGIGTAAVYEKLQKLIPVMEEDFYLYPYLEVLKDFIHSGECLTAVETVVGELE